MDNELRMNFHDKLMGLMHSMRRYHMWAQRHADPLQDVSRGRGRILAMLKIQDKMTSKDLGYLLGIRQQSLNESLKRLEKEGYVERQPDSQDHRVMRIHLMEKGKQVKQMQGQNDDLLADFSDEELRHFGSYVDRLRKSYDQHTAADFDAHDEKWADDMQEHMAAMRQQMGPEHFEQMMQRCHHMGMPMGMGCMGHMGHRHLCHSHHGHDFD